MKYKENKKNKKSVKYKKNKKNKKNSGGKSPFIKVKPKKNLKLKNLKLAINE